MFSVAINYGGTHAAWHFFKQFAQCGNQAVVQRVAFGGACQAHNGNFFVLAAELEVQIFLGHG